MPKRQIVLGDSLAFLRRTEAASVDLVYVDPPFNTGRRQRRRRMRSVRDDEAGDRTGFRGDRYRTVDLGAEGPSWDDDFDDFLGFLGPRLDRTAPHTGAAQ